MTHTQTPMANDPTRRATLGLIGGGLALTMVPGTAHALSDAQARSLIGTALGEVNAAIGSGKTGAALYADFERIFVRYADVPVIARSALGAAARGASAAQLATFTKVFRGYISRKYGRRFHEFEGSRFEVTGARQVKSFYEVKSIAYMRGESPFEVLWHVSDKSGKHLFFNIIIEGVNMLASERTEIGAMLDRRRGNIDLLIEDLKKAG